MYIVYETYKIDDPSKNYIGKHDNNDDSYLGSGVYLKRAIKKYGRKLFARKTLMEYELEEEAYEAEIEFIKERQPYYNISPGGLGSGSGWHHTTEAKEKISIAAKQQIKRNGYSLTEEHKKKIRDASTVRGVPLTEVHKNKISESHKGKILTESHKKKLSKAHKGKKVSQETKNKCGVASQKYWNNVSEEDRKERSRKIWETRRKNNG
jgi:hypothetical protein